MIIFAKKLKKENFDFIFCILLLCAILIITINPSKYISSTLKGLTVWAQIVLPSLFCFFVLTKMLLQSKTTLKIFSFFNKPFKLFFKTGSASSYIFFMSLISGYPLGAKLISEFYQTGYIEENEAHRLISFCSTTGPMFVLGSLASNLFGDIKMGIIIFVSHIFGAFINGFFYKNFKIKNCQKLKSKILKNETKQSINSIMSDTIISVLMIGGYITICFTLLEVLLNSKILSPLFSIFDKIFPNQKGLLNSLICGIVEVTNGCVQTFEFGFSKEICTILCCAMISFGGLSIHLQSQMFLSKCNIKYRYFLKTKITHTIISTIISAIFTYIIM